jgi:hypothetical protein
LRRLGRANNFLLAKNFGEDSTLWRIGATIQTPGAGEGNMQTDQESLKSIVIRATGAPPSDDQLGKALALIQDTIDAVLRHDHAADKTDFTSE